MVPTPGAVFWARFYELDTDRPIYVGRGTTSENERRAGYLYAGTWPEKLLTQAYPQWQQKQAKPAGQ
ncbi:pectate lyase [Hymenobacter sp. PAMC 26628]|uniref:pectate lyase n=1 Tax=Hymenobacter sp. PAMC 26628 TaxID=1484118 RepID=UPI000AD02236|nr:pectate lyase [Hymenobacter sp. PAMC 26628]